jgi:hypothetical protein
MGERSEEWWAAEKSRSFTPLNHPSDEDLSLGTPGKALRSG